MPSSGSARRSSSVSARWRHCRTFGCCTSTPTRTASAPPCGGAAQAASLQPQEVMLTRLNRPSHYLKPRDTHTGGGASAISSWLDPKVLYRITRNQTTGSVRALGRLALVDNYRDVAERMRTTLGACTEAEALASADRTTKLGLRINRPRIYVVTSLAGGTGSGMFLDVVYLRGTFSSSSAICRATSSACFSCRRPTGRSRRCGRSIWATPTLPSPS